MGITSFLMVKYLQMDRIFTTNYPSDDELVALMEELKSFSKVAKACGVARESLRDYLERRPHLKQRMDTHRPAKLSPEQRRERNRASGRRYKARMQQENPERIRELNRQWAKNQSPEKRARWNNYNREQRQGTATPRSIAPHLYQDPCAYCGADGGETDHIVPVKDGGTSEEDNLTAACRSCNSSKGSRFTLLEFLLYRLG